jgi:predicted dehydrogenase
MAGLAETGITEIAGISDVAIEACAKAAAIAPEATVVTSLDDLLALDLDGVVIATPSAQHAAQASAALQRGVAVFCQKPLGRTSGEVRQVIAAAQSANRLLCVDLSYRFTRGLQEIYSLVRSGALGHVYAAELTFHNAYGPDKDWFYDRALSGGGCVIDLGVHLVDLALWIFDAPAVSVSSRLFAGGRPLEQTPDLVEDYAVMRLDFPDGATAQVACSWRLHAGQDAIIEAVFYGTRASARWRNVNGSFFDFITEKLDGTSTTVLVEPPDEWESRAIVDWARRLGRGDGFDPGATRLIDVAAILDRASVEPCPV